MTDGIAFLVILILAGGALLALMNWLANLNRRRAAMTDEEYQNRERGTNLIGAGLTALDEILHTDKKRAAEYLIDAQQGHLPGGDQQGEKVDDENPSNMANPSNPTGSRRQQ
jgi:hypothetical protein